MIKINRNLKVRFSLWYIPIFFTILRYTIGIMAQFIYINKMVFFGTLLLSILLLVYLSDFKTTFTNYEFIWLIVFSVFICVRNYNVAAGDFNQIILYGYMLVFMLFSKNSTRWLRIYPEILFRIFMVHAIATIVIAVVPSLYVSYILPLVEPANRHTTLVKFQAGYIPGLTSHYSTNGTYLAFGTAVTFCKAIYSQKKFYWGCTLFMMVALFLTGKRAHTVISIFGMLVIYLLFDDNRSIGKYVKMFGAAIGVFLLLLVVARFIPSVWNSFNRLFDSEDYASFGGRTELYAEAIRYFKGDPLFGIGWAGYQERVQYTVGVNYSDEFAKMHTHNVYLELLSETGIIGLLIFLGLFAFALIKSILMLLHYDDSYYCKEDNCKLALSISVYLQIFFIAYCFTGNPLYDASGYMTYFAACAVMLTVAQQRKRALKKKYEKVEEAGT